MTRPDDPAATLLASIEALRRTLVRSDQAWWSDQLLTAERLGNDPEAAARTALALFEPPGNLDDLVLSYGGKVYVVDDERLWRWNTEYLEARSALYAAALALWLSLRRVSPLPARNGMPTQKLLDYGYGSEVWRVRERHHARRDVGALASRWRDDEITLPEAEQAALGPTHFTRMCTTLESRLKAAGVDPYQGSPTLLPDPC